MSRRWIASAALAAALVFTGGRQMSAQDVPRMANGKPDFSGLYTPPSTVKGTGPRGNLIFNADKMAPVKPGAESLLYRPRTGDARLDEPRAMCLPAGFPSGMLYILPIQIVQNPKHIVIIPELQRAARIIPTDGRAHRTGIEPSYYGDSVGRWDGDTLIIETVNFKPWILDDYHYTDPTKSRWHTDALRTTEHLTRDGNRLQYRITIDDPKIFTRPFSQDFELTLRPDWEPLGLLEYVCEENNRCAGGNAARQGLRSHRVQPERQLALRVGALRLLTSLPVDAIRSQCRISLAPAVDSIQESQAAPPLAVLEDRTMHIRNVIPAGALALGQVCSSRRSTRPIRSDRHRGDRQRPRQSARPRLWSRQGALRRRGWTWRQRQMHHQRRRRDRVLR